MRSAGLGAVSFIDALAVAGHDQRVAIGNAARAEFGRDKTVGKRFCQPEHRKVGRAGIFAPVQRMLHDLLDIGEQSGRHAIVGAYIAADPIGLAGRVRCAAVSTMFGASTTPLQRPFLPATSTV